MKDNVQRLRTAHSLQKRAKQSKQGAWRVVSEKIAGPRQNRSLVNIGEIQKHTEKGSTVLVAGKVLGAGSLDHSVSVGAFSFSDGARSKIIKSGGKCFNLEKFMLENKSTKGVIILG